MSKFQRLFSILFYINRKRKVTAGELSNEFGVSARTIQRDLAELEEWGLPLYSEQGPHGGYTVMKNNILPPLFFTEDEGLALYFSYEYMMHYQTLPFQTDMKAASDKLYLSFNETSKKKIDEIKNHISFLTPPQKIYAPLLNDILGSAVSHSKIEIEYEGKNGKAIRSIFPYGIYASNGLWYCPAYDYSSQDHRLFRVDRICSVKLIGAEESMKTNLSVWLSKTEQREQIPLKVQLTKNGVRECRSLPYLADYITQHHDGTGTISAKMPIDEISFMARNFYLLGGDAVVKEPQELIEMILSHAKAVQDQYKN
ncbi:helix-turn-helix transcriptional regulator [Metabacillus idriensis]|uniref:helix-turn-helix transcriptional regulator n=1 Tax=Metabacillus idriensis TaxID=324768 RepID=UPI003D2A7A14